MTAVTIDTTQAALLTAVRSFLVSILPAGVEVIKGQGNRVPEPKVADFVVLTPMFRERLATDVDRYTDGYPAAPSVVAVDQSTQVTIQADVHGPNSGENAQIITTMWRDEYGCNVFKSVGSTARPLYTSDPRQMPFINAEQQYEDRWSVDLVLHAHIVVTAPQDFAATIAVGLIPADIFYKP